MVQKDSALTNSVFTKYAGNPLFNLQTLIIAAGLIAFILIVVQTIIQDDYFDKNIFFLPASCIFIYFINARTFYYFLLSDDCLVVKNHCLPWKKFVYPLTEIKKLHYDNYIPTNFLHTLTFILVVTTKNGQQKNYIAKSLGNRQWKALHKKLLSLKMNVSDKAGYWE